VLQNSAYLADNLRYRVVTIPQSARRAAWHATEQEGFSMTDRYLIVGLGNPGKKYEPTRHNIGFQTIDALAKRHNFTFGGEERNALLAEGTIHGRRVLLAKPQTYMNASGDAVAPLVNFYKIPLAQLMIVCDEIDLPLGTLRLRADGTSGGQNGIKHIIERLGTQQFARMRLGIGRPPGRKDPTNHVLGAFNGDEAISADLLRGRAVQALEAWLTHGVDLAISQYNGHIDTPPQTPTPSKPKASVPE
jgi:peptidyl-tRNA hydrolase, PTH1 family